MTPEKVQEAMRIYRVELEKRGIRKKEHPHDHLVDCEGCALEHCHGMLDQMDIFIREGRMEKTFRWFGFIQGVLWSQKVYTIEEPKRHNWSGE